MQTGERYLDCHIHVDTLVSRRIRARVSKKKLFIFLCGHPRFFPESGRKKKDFEVQELASDMPVTACDVNRALIAH